MYRLDHRQHVGSSFGSRSGGRLGPRLHLSFAPARIAVAASLWLFLFLVPRILAAQAIPSSAKWITALGATEHSPQVVSFRKVVHFDALPNSYAVQVSADNRFLLYVNGQRVGEGPARGDRTHWRYETFDLRPFLQPGENVIAARVWNFGDQSPAAQTSVRTAFLLWTDTEPGANTNESWSARPESGWRASFQGFPASPGESVDAKTLDPKWDVLPFAGNWPSAIAVVSPVLAKDMDKSVLDYTWRLVPDMLPPMEYTPTSAGHVIRSLGAQANGFPGKLVQIAPHTHASFLLDRDTLTTAYPELVVGAGADAKVRLTYAEALVDEKGTRGNRNEVAGKHMDMAMLHDEFLPDGSPRCSFSPLWWRTWRFLQIDIDTGEQPLSVLELNAHFSAYPFQEKATFRIDDTELEKIWDVGWRTLRVNAHETHTDCPYWEQLQYVGDTRIETLIDYVESGDDRLAKQAIEAIADSAIPDGLTQSRYPSNGLQVIPPFSLLWIGMVHDYWWYRPDTELPRKVLPLARSVITWFADHQRPDGMLGKLPQNGFEFWNFVDWSFAPIGAPPEDTDGGSVPLTLQFVAALRDAADLEEAVGDPTRAKDYQENAKRTAEAVYRLSWDDHRQLLADTPARREFSQHANILGVMLDIIPAEKQQQVLKTILADEFAGQPAYPASQNLTAASYYFRFYLARALDHAGMGDLYLKLLGPWKEMLHLGLTTWAETPEPTRSDAHAWSAHPNYDFLTIVAGIRPDAPGFKRVRIVPHLGDLTSLGASMPHDGGNISISYQRTIKGIEANVTLPPGLAGALEWRGHELPLSPGQQHLVLR